MGGEGFTHNTVQHAPLFEHLRLVIIIDPELGEQDFVLVSGDGPLNEAR